MNDGGPAFPKQYEKLPGQLVEFYGNKGMSLRDWFAGMALQAVAVESTLNDHLPDDLAKLCYAYADAMLQHREKST